MIRTAAVTRLATKSAVRGLATAKYTLPTLPYGYGDLAPYISPALLEIHHAKHHATYVNNLNTFSAKLEEAIAKNDLSQVITLQNAVKFHGGGHINHAIFWKNLAPPKNGGGEPPTGELKTMIDAQYGSLDNLISALSAASIGVQGSGWGWLGYDKVNKRLAIATTGNQDLLEATTGLTPLLAIDVWEHVS